MAKVRITNEKNKRIFSFLLLDCRVLNKNKKVLLVFFSLIRISDYRRRYSRSKKLKILLVFFSLIRIFAFMTSSHLWYMPSIYLTSSEGKMLCYSIGALLDYMTTFPLAIVIADNVFF